jgi:hypothetical protein
MSETQAALPSIRNKAPACLCVQTSSGQCPSTPALSFGRRTSYGSSCRCRSRSRGLCRLVSGRFSFSMLHKTKTGTGTPYSLQPHYSCLWPWPNTTTHAARWSRSVQSRRGLRTVGTGRQVKQMTPVSRLFALGGRHVPTWYSLRFFFMKSGVRNRSIVCQSHYGVVPVRYMTAWRASLTKGGNIRSRSGTN